MIVGKAVDAQGKETIVVGVTKDDWHDLKAGLTKVKQGGEDFGFRTLLLFMGESDEEMIKTLSQAGTVRRDDKFPNIGSG